jgi:stage II sporulation protein M
MKKWWSAICEERRYFTMMAVVFVTSAVTGYFQGDSLTTFLKQAGVFEEIEKVVQSIQSQPTFLNAFVSIFLNNLFATMMIILLGALFFGIYPFSAMLMNGMLLGTTLHIASHTSGQNPWAIFVQSILPHGIMELPALFMAAGLGIHLGMAVLRRVLSVFSSERMQASIAEWKRIRSRLVPNLTAIVVLLFFAAIVEAALIIYGMF